MITNNFVLNTVKQIWVLHTSFEILKSWDCLEIEFDQRVWDRIFSCIDFIFASVTSVILVSVERNLCVFAEKCCVFLRGSRSVFLVCWCVDQEKCVSWGDQGHFLGCVVSDLGLIAWWNSSVVSEKTGCSSGFRVNQYKHAFSLSLISLNSVLIFANWYKQSIASWSNFSLNYSPPLV